MRWRGQSASASPILHAMLSGRPNNRAAGWQAHQPNNASLPRHLHRPAARVHSPVSRSNDLLTQQMGKPGCEASMMSTLSDVLASAWLHSCASCGGTATPRGLPGPAGHTAGPGDGAGAPAAAIACGPAGARAEFGGLLLALLLGSPGLPMSVQTRAGPALPSPFTAGSGESVTWPQKSAPEALRHCTLSCAGPPAAAAACRRCTAAVSDAVAPPSGSSSCVQGRPLAVSWAQPASSQKAGLADSTRLAASMHHTGCGSAAKAAASSMRWYPQAPAAAGPAGGACRSPPRGPAAQEAAGSTLRGHNVHAGTAGKERRSGELPGRATKPHLRLAAAPAPPSPPLGLAQS